MTSFAHSSIIVIKRPIIAWCPALEPSCEYIQGNPLQSFLTARPLLWANSLKEKCKVSMMVK